MSAERVLLIYGSRGWSDQQVIADELFAFAPTRVIHGNARGADTLGGLIAAKAGIPVRVYPADWTTYGRRAGYIRNAEMRDALLEELSIGSVVFAIGFRLPGKSVGTDMMTNLLAQRGIPHKVVQPS